ncbi:Putative NADPH-dependent reductase flavoprotein component, possibly involved in thiamine biosynthesis [Oxalobacteraceae bacterium IMCC9480]|nr:Putative NADPH-dependent reductase flavoprotein component, possibly involved in thiamine biosynthesis [Oxalobacteraceae bacterium IMCC9480]NDP58624.1 nitric oxide synthase [Oxalobacteraceae bacterium]
MLRKMHSFPGLIASVFLLVLAISGAILSLDPALERLATTVPATGQVSVAALAGRVAQHYPGVEQIQRSPSGAVIVYYSKDGQSGADLVDPLTGQRIAAHVNSGFSRWVKKLHRSLLLDTPGRAAVGVAAVCMLILSMSGAVMLARRAGGWRHLLRPLHGSASQRWHARVGRLVVTGLLLSALTGSYLSAVTFGFISDGMQNEPGFPARVAGGPVAPVTSLTALQTTDLNGLRELVYPRAGDAADVYSLRTAQGDGYVDQATGALLSYRAHDGVRSTYELIYRLHTGEGLWWLGLLLGTCALGVPLMSATGILVWWQRRRDQPRIIANARAQAADTVILVGSENNSTWGFASALHDALRQAGHVVHTAPMNQMATQYRCAQRLFILTSTYGDGAAPASANQFLARLAGVHARPDAGFAVLGFGDRQFAQFCQFARDVDAALAAQGWARMMAFDTIDRQSPQEFSRWGTALGACIGQEITLSHVPRLPSTYALQLVERFDYGVQVQAPTSVLRFAAVPAASWWRRLFGGGLPHFEAGDLVGIVPPGSAIPRLYSLASASSNGILEICVRKHPDGLCSSFLHGLQTGGRIDAFIQSNLHFRPASGKAPVILIGAGTGIGPLAGFIRNNTGRHPMVLYWGGRDPASDFLYEPQLRGYLSDHRLTQLHAAFSRIKDGAYVQDRISDDALQIRDLIEQGGQVLVCGSRAMAASVMQVLDQVLAPLNLTVQILKTEGRYREDVY